MYTSPPSSSLTEWLLKSWHALRARSGQIFGAITILALVAFETFNYTTTDFALTDLLGDMRFAGLRWAVILAVAFCGMDFAGLARLFSPERSQHPKTENWYLLGAWFLAAAMNALLTWWGVSLALLNHANLGNEILSRDVLLNMVPVFVSVLVVLIRVLLIGTFTMTSERLFPKAEAARPPARVPVAHPMPARPIPAAAPAAKTIRPMPAPPPDDLDWELDEPEPRRAAPPPRMTTARPPAPVPAQPIRPAPKPAPRPVPLPGELSHEANGHNGNSEPR